MGLFEHNLPYTNFHELNLDTFYNDIVSLKTDCEEHFETYDAAIEDINASIVELSNDVETLQTASNNYDTRIATLEDSMDDAETNITDIGNSLNNIIDDVATNTANIATNTENIATANTNITAVNSNSVGRDSALSNRVAILEDATINPITLFSSNTNLIATGNDLAMCKRQANGLPYGCNLSSTGANQPWVYTNDLGFTAQDVSGTGYLEFPFVDARWMGSGGLLRSTYTITLAVSDDATRNIEYVSVTTNDMSPYDIINASAKKVCSARIVANSDHNLFTLRLMANRSGNGIAGLTGKHITAVKCEYGDSFTGLNYERETDVFFDALESAVNNIDINDLYTPEQYGNTYSVTMVSGENTYNASVQVNLARNLAVLSGYVAVYCPVPVGGNANFTFNPQVVTTIDISALNLPAKATWSPIISGAQTDILTRTQADALLIANANNTSISSLELRLFCETKNVADVNGDGLGLVFIIPIMEAVA